MILWFAVPTEVHVPPKSPLIVELEPKEPKRDGNKNRVVQTEERQKEKEAAKDAFLGKQNQKVEKQTVSKNRATPGGSSAPQKMARKNSLNTPGPSKVDGPNLSKLGVSLFVPGSNTEPQPDQPQWATPGTRPEDYVNGMTEAAQTALNTREFIYYGYFQRIRDQLDRAWVPILRARLANYFKSGRQLASDQDHTTRVFVVLNENGQIIRVQIQAESGTKDLDEAAIAAFNKAGPFPNPPKGMIDRQREVKIAWDFILKT